MRASDIVYAFPAVLIAIMLAAAYGRSTTTAMIAIGIAYIPVFARLTRGSALQVLRSDYVLAARALRPPAARDPDAPRPAEHRRDPDRAGDRAVRRRDPRRGRALLPRPRHVAADPDLGRHAHEQPDVPERPRRCWRSGRASRSRSQCSASACSATGCGTCSIRDCGADERRAAGRARSHGRARRPETRRSRRLRARSGRAGRTDRRIGQRKSLTALAIMGLLPDELQATGSAALDGTELLGLPERELAPLRGERIAMVFQEPMTALDPMMRSARRSPRSCGCTARFHVTRLSPAPRSCSRWWDCPLPRAAAGLSPPALRRPAPTGADRHGARLRPLRPDRRRADHRARRHRAGADPRAAAPARRRSRHRTPPDHARPPRDRIGLRARARAAGRTDHRARPDRGGLQVAARAPYAGDARGHPGARRGTRDHGATGRPGGRRAARGARAHTHLRVAAHVAPRGAAERAGAAWRRPLGEPRRPLRHRGRVGLRQDDACAALAGARSAPGR